MLSRGLPPHNASNNELINVAYSLRVTTRQPVYFVTMPRSEDSVDIRAVFTDKNSDQTENAWQSLACSPSGVAVSTLENSSGKTPIIDRCSV